MKAITRRGMTKGLMLLMVVSTIAMIPQKASASDWILMNVPGIPGGSTIRANWIDVISFSGTGVAPDSNGSARRNQSSPAPCQITVLKQLDIAGPRLWSATVTAQTFSSIELQVVVSSGTTSRLLCDIMLTDAQITSVSDSGATAAGFPTETVTFKAGSLTLAYSREKDDGTGGPPITTTFACN